jgi:uncharacterized protein YdeI (YjbR/CyaY-like superfamily)
MQQVTHQDMQLNNTKEGLPLKFFRSVDEWRNWLHTNGNTTKGVWLILYHKNAATESLHWHDAIEHALCYGWVDSKAGSRDKQSCFLKFTPRNPESKWGKRNMERAEKMIEAGLMNESGYNLILRAKEKGRWIFEK